MKKEEERKQERKIKISKNSEYQYVYDAKTVVG